MKPVVFWPKRQERTAWARPRKNRSGLRSAVRESDARRRLAVILTTPQGTFRVTQDGRGSWAPKRVAVDTPEAVAGGMALNWANRPYPRRGVVISASHEGWPTRAGDFETDAQDAVLRARFGRRCRPTGKSAGSQATAFG